MRVWGILVGLGGAAVLAGLTAGGDPGPGADDKATPEKAMAEARARWNKAAEGVKVPGFGGEFSWEENRFPHPTFKGGGAGAYGAFARVLVKFLDEKGNFDYLADNGLLTAKLRYTFPNGKDADVDWTFAKLVTDLSGPKAPGDHDEATRKALKGYAEKIAERTKKDKEKK